ncbi:MAG: response regulator [Planctomycetota bacterium]
MAELTGTVFLVDDDGDSLRAGQNLVDSMRSPHQSFTSAETFLDSYNGDPGCLVTDYRMPGMNGLELVKELQQRDRSLPFVLVTAYARTPLVVEAMRLGALSVLEKPCNDDELWQVIRQGLSVDAVQREALQKTAHTREKLSSLTQKEQQVLDLVLAGEPNKTMAERLGVSLRTIENRRRNVFQKLEVGTVAELVTAVLSTRQALEQRTTLASVNSNGAAPAVAAATPQFATPSQA